jgi:hypothetical protein
MTHFSPIYYINNDRPYYVILTPLTTVRPTPAKSCAAIPLSGSTSRDLPNSTTSVSNQYFPLSAFPCYNLIHPVTHKQSVFYLLPSPSSMVPSCNVGRGSRGTWSRKEAWPPLWILSPNPHRYIGICMHAAIHQIYDGSPGYSEWPD